MRVLVVGGGAREHILCWRLASEGNEILSFMKNENPGIVSLATSYKIGDERNVRDIVGFGGAMRADLAVIGPEDPLESGISDALNSAGIPCFGPSSSAAEIETSKAFARRLLSEHGIEGSPEYAAFRSAEEAISYARQCKGELVVKPSGLTGGKGVKIEGEQLRDREETCSYIRQIFDERIGGGGEVVLEEKLKGEEFSLQAITDGRKLFPLPLVQDHKRALEDDRGPNTGGMGSYSMADGLLPFLSREDVDRAMGIMSSTVQALRNEGREFRGTLYGGFMRTDEGVRLLEFNARFGDPEVINVLSVMKGQFAETLLTAAEGNMRTEISFEKKASVCRYFVPVGYGSRPVSGAEINVDERCIEASGCALYYGSVSKKEGRLLTTTSRSLALVAVADEPWLAVPSIENASKCISGMLYSRKDIGTREEIERKRRRR